MARNNTHRNKRWRKYARSHSSDACLVGRGSQQPQQQAAKKSFIILFFLYSKDIVLVYVAYTRVPNSLVVIAAVIFFCPTCSCATRPPSLIHSGNLHCHRGGFKYIHIFGWHVWVARAKRTARAPRKMTKNMNDRQ